MRNLQTALAVLVFVFSGSLFAATEGAGAPAAASKAEVSGKTPRYEIIPQISVLNPADFALTTDSYTAHYSKSAFGLPMLLVGAGARLGTLENLEFFLDGKLGYGGKGGVIPVSTRYGGGVEETTFNQDVRLHWMPIEVSGRMLWSIPGVTFVRPTLSAGLGSSLVIQTSSLPGFSHTYLLPFFQITPGLTFLEGSRTANDWFGGFLFGFTYLQTFATEQSMHGTSVDLSVNILL